MKLVDDLKPGTRIRLLEMPNDPAPIPLGSEGTVQEVIHFPGNRSWTQIRVRWDVRWEGHRRTLSLCVPPDRYEVIR